MVNGTHIDRVRLGTALAVALFLGLFWWGAITLVANGADAPSVEMMAMPDGGKPIPMPPKWMRTEIERRMASGDVPAYIETTPSRLRKSCRSEGYLLGCVVDFRGLKVTYIRKGMSTELRHMALVHEYGHYLYGWVHQ
jgi:hypothetical protein